MQNHPCNQRVPFTSNRANPPVRRDLNMGDGNQNPTSNEPGEEASEAQSGQHERSLEYRQSYSVLPPSEEKRTNLLQQREKNMQLYEEAKAMNKKKYQTDRPSKTGGPKLSKEQLLEKRLVEQKKAEALEKRKVYEQQKKREKWAAEKKSIEDKEINERKQKARAQSERNAEKKRQEEIAKREKYDEERRRRWERAGNEERKKRELAERCIGEDESSSQRRPADMRDFYARRYDKQDCASVDNKGEFSRNRHVELRRDYPKLVSPTQRTYEQFQTSSCKQTGDSGPNDESNSAQDDIRKLSQMFPLVSRDIIEDIYLQTNESFADTRAILSIN